MWQGGGWEEISHLNQVGSDSMGENEKGGKEKEKKRKKKESGVRSSTFSLNLRRLSRRFSLEQETKFIYATRASRRYKNMGFSPNSKRQEFLSYFGYS